MVFSDALDREAAWLNAVDTLPSLLLANGGPFAVIQARWPRTMWSNKTGLYVTRTPGHTAQLERFAAQRQMLKHHLRIIAHWPFTSGSGSSEADQFAFDQAIDLVLARVAGVRGDKTHGGRFLSVAEDPAMVDVDIDDAEQAITAGHIRARITYWADDTETNN